MSMPLNNSFMYNEKEVRAMTTIKDVVREEVYSHGYRLEEEGGMANIFNSEGIKELEIFFGNDILVITPTEYHWGNEITDVYYDEETKELKIELV